MTYNTLFMWTTAGFALMACLLTMDRYARTKALRHHERARAIGHLHNACVKAEMMVQTYHLDARQTRHVMRYIDLMEHTHLKLGLGVTCRFDRLRQSLIRNSKGLQVVV